ncbi:hypothetical protein ACFSBZ_14520 [Amnibacterium flavum]|uniref:Uncharacterized protein n=1 Tax=Amnibacterium flavum TaxID=2173173 RepID=A0A2V1HTQ7_9MICO|nr:hypothetical protein [Amnibacterium flavum]PVZ95953.1 hypothetical protein DDQ50_05720 [Amnibacterium flavum]
MTEAFPSSDDADRGDRIDDPSVAGEIEEYQIVDPPLTDEERTIDEEVEDPEAPLVDPVPDDSADPAVDPRAVDDFPDIE